MNEFDIIAEIFAPLATAPGAFGLTDDAAIIPQRPGFDLVVTTDQIAAGTDFMADDPAGLVARKALRPAWRSRWNDSGLLPRSKPGGGRH